MRHSHRGSRELLASESHSGDMNHRIVLIEGVCIFKCPFNTHKVSLLTDLRSKGALWAGEGQSSKLGHQ